MKNVEDKAAVKLTKDLAKALKSVDTLKTKLAAAKETVKIAKAAVKALPKDTADKDVKKAKKTLDKALNAVTAAQAKLDEMKEKVKAIKTEIKTQKAQAKLTADIAAK